MVYLNAFLLAREWLVEQRPTGKTRCVPMWVVYSSGFWAVQSLGLWLLWVQAGPWVERDWGYALHCWVRTQGPNGFGYYSAVH